MISDFCFDNCFRQTGVGPMPQMAPMPHMGPMLPPMTPFPFGSMQPGTTAQGPQMVGQQGAQQGPGQGEFEQQPGAPIFQDVMYTQGYLRQNIGKTVRVEFLIGTNTLTDRTGILQDVGISYIILRERETNNLVLCDIYTIKFVTFYQQAATPTTT